MTDPLEEIKGQRFGRWIVLDKAGRNKHRAHLWLCQCDCGTIRKVTAQSLRKKQSRSCRCFQSELVGLRSQKPAHIDISNWNRENLAWAAGLFEGEGCICIYKNNNGRSTLAYISLTNTDFSIIDRFHNIIGSGAVINKPSYHKPARVWRINRLEEVYAILVALYFWLSEKRRKKAIETIKLFTQRPAWRGNG